MFRTLLKTYIERFKHDPKFIDFSIYLLLHVLPFVERLKSASLGYRLLRGHVKIHCQQTQPLVNGHW